MHELISLILIGIALSMDTFSLSLSIGAFNINLKKAFLLSSIVGSFHFFMPILGMGLGNRLVQAFELKCDILLGIVLLFIALQMLIDMLKNEEETFSLSLFGMFLFAFGVSIDSFSVGLGLKAITDNIILATSNFAICSFLFTLSGTIIGSFTKKLIGKYANILGFLILTILGILHIL